MGVTLTGGHDESEKNLPKYWERATGEEGDTEGWILGAMFSLR